MNGVVTLSTWVSEWFRFGPSGCRRCTGVKRARGLTFLEGMLPMVPISLVFCRLYVSSCCQFFSHVGCHVVAHPSKRLYVVFAHGRAVRSNFFLFSRAGGGMLISFT